MAQLYNLFCLIVLLGAAAVVVEGQQASDCVANATAMTGDIGAIGDAVANSVAGTLTKDINCQTGELVDKGQGTPGFELSFALALAISVAENIGQNCSSEASASAEELTAQVIGQEVSKGIESAPAPPGTDKLIAARAAALQKEVSQEVSQTVMTEDPAVLAERIGREILLAAANILRAVKCTQDPIVNNKGRKTGKCVFRNGRFIGNCNAGATQQRKSTPKKSECPFVNGVFLC